MHLIVLLQNIIVKNWLNSNWKKNY